MALEQIGVKLVAEDGKQYIATLREASGATDSLKGVVSGFAGASKGGSGAVNSLAGAMGGLSLKAGLATGAIGLLVGGVAMAGKTLSGMVQTAMGATAAYEALEQSMTSLVAREMMVADESLTMSDALDVAGERAEYLLQWIEQLAIKSPFGQEGVANTFKTALAYGFTSDNAQILTNNLINMATANGDSVVAMERAILALGQMKAAGRVLGGELLQLRQVAGVETNMALEAMGLTAADVGKKHIDSAQFIMEFSKILERNYQGAAERSAGTIAGLQNSIEDLGQIGLRQAFGPAIQATIPLLSAFVDKIQEFMPAIQAFGEGLGQIVSSLVSAFFPALTEGAEEASRTYTGVMEEVKDSTADTASAMFDYGANIVTSLAEGMASAIDTILTVITWIAEAISYWLAPGSPPKILPDIDDWGTSAMNEFIGGFTKADFGVFNQISGTIEKVLRSGMGKDNTGLIPAIMGARGAVASAINEIKEIGSVSATTMEHLNDILGDANQSAMDYAKAVFDVTIAQEKLNKITERARETIKPMNEELEAIAKRREQIATNQRKDELAKILEDENAPALAKELAAMELRELQLRENIKAVEDQANAEAESAMTELEMAQKRLDMQQMLIDTQLENNKLIKEQIDLLERLAKSGGGGGGGGGGAGKGPGKGIPKLPGGGLNLGDAFQMPEGLTEKVEEVKTQITTIMDDLAGKVESTKLKVTMAWDAVKLKWEEVTTAFQTGWQSWSDIFNVLLPTSLEQAKLKLTTWLNTTAENIATWLNETWDKWSTYFDDLKTGWQEWTDDAYERFSTWLEDTKEDLLGWVDETWEKLDRWFSDVTELMRDLRTKGVDFLRSGLESLKNKLKSIIGSLEELWEILANMDLGAMWEFVSHSPSPIERGIVGANRAMRQFTAMVPHALPETRQSAVVARGGSGSVTNNQFMLGGNNINNGMDMAVFEATVERVVMRAIANG